MIFSSLQRFILKKSYSKAPKKIDRKIFNEYYKNNKKSPDLKVQVKIITQSLERLIERGLIIGFGKKTQEKYFIEEIKLTPRGRKAAKKLFGTQTSLPILKKKKNISKHLR